MNEQLLIRFLARRCTPEEIEQVAQWVAAGEANGEWLFEMERIWSLKDELRFSDAREIEIAYNEFMSKIAPPQKQVWRAYLRPALKYAAAVLVIGIGIGAFFWKRNTTSVASENTVEVPIGQRASLTLSDGSKVWLNSKSKLTYPVDFQQGNRKLRLEGEGYFEVADLASSPFTVETPSVKVDVLGTKFNLKAYDTISSVILQEGKVRVSVADMNNAVVLRPNEQAVYIRGKDTLTVSTVNTGDKVAWIKGVLFFDDEPMDEVLKTLSRRYDVRFEIGNSQVREKYLTMKITDEPLELTLEYMRRAIGIQYKIERRVNVSDKNSTYHVTLY